MHFDVYRLIKPNELLNLAWSKPKLRHLAINVQKMTRYFNSFSNWVSYIILYQDKIRSRSKTINKLIKIMEHLYHLNNFNGVMSISAGLNNTAIYRLKDTWDDLSIKSIEFINEMENLFSSNYKGYRQLLKTISPPCIPYLGVYLTDLTFVEEGNLDFISTTKTNEKIINWQKRKLIYTIINNIQQFQQLSYNLQPVHQIQEFLRKIPNVEDSELFRLSLEKEPR